MTAAFDVSTSPASRPLLHWSARELHICLQNSLRRADGARGAHCIHELWMRGELAANIDAQLESLWQHAAASIPEWLPMRHIECLATVYEVALRFRDIARGRSNLYLVLLDYSDSRTDPHGLYVGMSRYTPAQRFDQHKAGIRAAGSVLRRGVEVLTGPTLHLQGIRHSNALLIEEQLAEALRAEGLLVQGGH